MDENIKGIARLELLISALGISQKDLSDKTGLSTSVISHYITGERGITAKSALKIQSAFPAVNPDWLLTGDGKMFLQVGQSEADEAEEQELVRLREENIRLREGLERQNKITAELSAVLFELTKPKSD